MEQKNDNQTEVISKGTTTDAEFDNQDKRTTFPKSSKLSKNQSGKYWIDRKRITFIWYLIQVFYLLRFPTFLKKTYND